MSRSRQYIVHTLEEAIAFAEKIGFPIIVRPAYTLGGTVAVLPITEDFKGTCTGRSDKKVRLHNA